VAALTSNVEIPELPSKDWMLAHWQHILEEYHQLFDDYGGHVETDRYGNLLMSPPPGDHHQAQADWICQALQSLLPSAHVRQGLAVLTTEGIKIPDLIAELAGRRAHMKDTDPYDPAPDICLEVISPSNSRAEIAEKTDLYLAAGALEVWICDRENRLSFYTATGARDTSSLCPAFPTTFDPSQSVVRGKDSLLLSAYDQLVKTPEDRARLEKDNPALVAERDRIVQAQKRALLAKEQSKSPVRSRKPTT
jgi:Uma2 family endonuclease